MQRERVGRKCRVTRDKKAGKGRAKRQNTTGRECMENAERKCRAAQDEKAREDDNAIQIKMKRCNRTGRKCRIR